MACDKTKAKEALTKAFQKVDTDKSGSLESAEIERVLQEYYKQTGKPCDNAKCKKEAQDFLKDVDKNQDHKVSMEEFIQYFMQFCK